MSHPNKRPTTTSWPRRVEQVGRVAVIVGAGGLAMLGAVTRQLPGVTLPAAPVVSAAAALSCTVIAAATLAILATRQSRAAAWLAITFWAATAVAALGQALTAGPALTNLVAPAESAIVALALGRAARVGSGTLASGAALAVAFAPTLALFGAVHVSHPADIAALVPSWLPAKAVVPYVTGALMLLAAPALVISRSRAASALTVAALFAAWLPLVHLPRILATPDSGFEWRFALMALCLSGALPMAAFRPAPQWVGPAATRKTTPDPNEGVRTWI